MLEGKVGINKKYSHSINPVQLEEKENSSLFRLLRSEQLPPAPASLKKGIIELAMNG